MDKGLLKIKWHKLRWSQPQDKWGESVPDRGICMCKIPEVSVGKRGPECLDLSDVRGESQEKW